MGNCEMCSKELKGKQRRFCTDKCKYALNSRRIDQQRRTALADALRDLEGVRAQLADRQQTAERRLRTVKRLETELAATKAEAATALTAAMEREKSFYDSDLNAMWLYSVSLEKTLHEAFEPTVYVRPKSVEETLRVAHEYVRGRAERRANAQKKR